jgi:hypothetical protein
VIEKMPWSSSARAPHCLKKLPNAPSHAVNLSDEDVQAAIHRSAERSRQRAKNLIENSR